MAKSFKPLAYIFVCCLLLLTACSNRTNPAPTTNPGEITPGQGAAAPNSTSENGQPQQQSGSSIGAPPAPTNSGSTNYTSGNSTESAPTENAADTTAQTSQAAETESAQSGTADGNNTNNLACTLLSTGEIQTVLQTPVNEGQAVSKPTTGLTTCQYIGTDASLSVKVDVTVYEGNQAEIAANNATQGTAVPDLGDQAYQSSNSVYVRVDTRWLLVGVSGSDKLSVKPADAALQLARIAAQKLGAS